MAQMTPMDGNEQGWHLWMKTRAGRATSTSSLDAYEYLVLFLYVLPTFYLEIIFYTFKVRLKLYTSFKII
jgi:hypothetical protein